MKFEAIKSKANALFNEAAFLPRINNKIEYSSAMEFMELLLEDYDANEPLIDMLAMAIEKWECQAPEFAEFNQRIESMDGGVAVLKTLMEQHQLKAEDLKNELGSKSLVSMILNGSRKLTIKHIEALSRRFNISPALFF